MEFRNATEAISQALTKMDVAEGRAESEIESIDYAEVDERHVASIMQQPRVILETIGVKVSDESQINVTAKNRALRASAARRLRRVIIIVIHYRNCDADIVIIA